MQLLLSLLGSAIVQARIADATTCGDGFPLLGVCLGLLFSDRNLTRLRMRLYADPAMWGAVVDLASAAGLAPAFAFAVSDSGLLPPISSRAADGGLGATLGMIRAEHDARRREMRDRLLEIVDDLGSAGIEAILLKGAVSLWTGDPTWRSMRDLDVLVSPQSARHALERLRNLGYREAPDAEASSHHLPVLVREDLPGWLELHIAPLNRRGAAIFPVEQVLDCADSVASEDGRVAVRLPAPDLHVLLGLVHHHFSNRGAAYGVIAPKGLLEFAYGYSQLDPECLYRLRQKAAANPRLAAAVDLWIAAASDWLCLGDDPRFQSTGDAAARWRSIRRRTEEGAPCSLVSALIEDVRMSWSRKRLADSVAARKHGSLAAAALSSVLTFMRESPSTPRRRAEARQRATGFTAVSS